MVEVIVVGENVAVVGHNQYKKDLLDHLNSRILQQDVSMRDISEFNKVYISFDEYPMSNEITVVQTFRGWIIVAPTSQEVESTLTEKEFNQYRVDHLIPHQGFEITPAYHPFNCGLDNLVHEAKGCYIGQEILTRMRSRNKTGKALHRVEGEQQDATTTGNTHSLVIRRN